MRKKLLWITETAVMLALLVALQAITKPAGQLVTGSFVNIVLSITPPIVANNVIIEIKSIQYCFFILFFFRKL